VGAIEGLGDLVLGGADGGEGVPAGTSAEAVTVGGAVVGSVEGLGDLVLGGLAGGENVGGEKLTLLLAPALGKALLMLPPPTQPADRHPTPSTASTRTSLPGILLNPPGAGCGLRAATGTA
jgi:hypothetical protein